MTFTFDGTRLLYHLFPYLLFPYSLYANMMTFTFFIPLFVVVTNVRTLDLAAETTKAAEEWKAALLALLIDMSPEGSTLGIDTQLYIYTQVCTYIYICICINICIHI
jgi:hypothetical protein